MKTQSLALKDLWMRNSFHVKLSGGEGTFPQIFNPIRPAMGVKEGNPNFEQRECVGDLVRQHSHRLFLIILRMVQSYSVAEDILQDTWMKVVRKLHQHDPSLPFSPWLTQIAVNRCRDYWRKKARQGGSGAVDKSQDIDTLESEKKRDTQAEIESRDTAQKALMCLSPKLREVVVMKFYSGFTGEEIADILKLPSGTVKSRLNAALDKMRIHLKRGEAA